MQNKAPIKWFQSYKGKRLFPLRPSVADVDIEEIAHALAMKCRFNGHCRTFYSVAQHSVMVSQFVPRGLALPGLLHDASEYMLPDVVTPVKPQIKGFHEIEEGVLDAVFKKFGILAVRSNEDAMRAIKVADLQVLAIEARDLMPNQPEDWNIGYEADPYYELTPWSPEVAEQKFMERYNQVLELAAASAAV